MSKRCSKCFLTKDNSEFGRNTTKLDGLQSNCKACRNNYAAGWYATNQQVQKARVRKTDSERRVDVRRKMLAYLGEHPCVDCGESDVLVLDCDHTFGKTRNISNMLSSKVSWGKIEEELKKCVTRCANCHRRKTAKDQKWYKILAN
jgi:hypothetical protein